MAISFGNGVSLTPGSPNVPWPTAASAVGLVNGTYPQYPTGCTVIASRTNPTFTFTGTASSTPLDVIAIPANSIGPSGYLDFEIKWSCNSSAGSKSILVVLGHTNFGWQDAMTTNVSSTIKFSVYNRGNSSAQIIASGPAGGQSASAFDTYAVDFTQEQRFTIWCGLAAGTDSVKVEGWTVKAFNPPVYSSSRIQYCTKLFYGANAHFDDSQTIAFHIAGLKTMGMKIMRMTWEGGGSLATLQAYASALVADGTGIQMLCCLDLSITTDGVHPYASEAAAYAGTFASVQSVVSALAPLGVTLFECGNEMDTKAGINTGDPQGGFPSDFSNSLVPIFRGVQRGAIDAVHSVGASLTAISNAYTVCSVALADMLWYNFNPDGSSGSGVVRWDATSWHNYEDYGPLTAVEMGNSRPWVNIYEYANRRWGGKPIFITEWNGKSSDTDPQRASWASRHMFEAFNNRYRWNIASILVYELYGSPWAVLDGVANTPISTFGTTVQSFISSNVDTGL